MRKLLQTHRGKTHSIMCCQTEQAGPSGSCSSAIAEFKANVTRFWPALDASSQQDHQRQQKAYQKHLKMQTDLMSERL